MEHFALNILMDEEGNPSQAARELSEKYEEVMVDEYQDSNLVQEMITSMVSGWSQDRKIFYGRRCEAEYLPFPTGKT